MRVAVVGAGIGGLTLGLALRARGVEVDLYERADELREVGAAVALSANGSRELVRLGLGDALDRVATMATELIFRDGRSGERIAAHPGGAAYRERFGAPYWGIHRVDLQQGLALAFGDEHLHLGHAVTGVHDDGRTIVFDDGYTVTADVVVGADGVHSVVREFVAPGSGPTYSGTSAFRGLVPRRDLPSLPDPLAIQFWAGPDAHLLHSALGGVERDDDTVNFFAVLCGPQEWEGGDAQHRGEHADRGARARDAGHSNRPASDGELLAAFAGWHPAVVEMLGAVEQSPRWPLLSQPPLTRWCRSRAVLLGDACHAMLPHHGQGANQSIEDAVVLADLLAAGDPDTALDLFPRRRRGRTRAVARSAWETGTLLHLPDDDDGLKARDARLENYLPANDWVHDHTTAPATT